VISFTGKGLADKFVGHLSFACRVCCLFTVATDVAHDSVFIGQYSVDSGKWEVRSFEYFWGRNSRKAGPTISPIIKFTKTSSRACLHQRLQLKNNFCHRACPPRGPQQNIKISLTIQILLAGSFLSRLLTFSF
jgi:hypothetical protein